MKNVNIRKLILRNFKGVQSLSIDFGFNTNIRGRNRAGKTTIADAYFWLLYGKDSFDRTDFEIKTLDKENKPFPKLEHEVVGVFDIDGIEIKLSKIFKEKWVKKRGSETEEMSGHETFYFVNDVPTSAAEYKKKVSEIIDESISKVLTNPVFFNEKIKWQERREMLSTMAGEITDSMVLNSGRNLNHDFSEVSNILNSGRKIEEEKKVISVKKKKLKDEIEQIPSRLDELNRQKPEDLEWDALEYKIKTIDEDIQSKTEKVDNVNKSIQDQKEKILEIQKGKFEKEQELDRLSREQTQKQSEERFKKQQKRDQLKQDLDRITAAIERSENSINQKEALIIELSSKNASLRSEFGTIQAQQFELDSSKCKCPTCKQELLNASEIEAELRANFNNDKLQKIEEINKRGISNNKIIKEAESEIEDRKKDLEFDSKKKNDFQAQLDSPELTVEDLKIQIEPTEQMIQLKAEIEAIEVPAIYSEDISVIRQEIEAMRQNKRSIEIELNKKIQIEGIDLRIEELNDQLRTLSQELAGLEKIEMQIDRFNKAKIEMIEESINSRFKFVNFKMFDTQLNGGESPACECLVGGVPYSSLNTELKLNASLDIINAFQNHYQVFAPIFIDGRESVTDLISMNCQIISLIVDPSEEKIKVEICQ